jgi:predicted branched-subunit amino acid permease
VDSDVSREVGREVGRADGIIVRRRGEACPALLPPFTVRTYFSRHDFIAGVRDMIPPLIGLVPFGMVCGVAAQALGASVWGALGLSAIVFSGAAQIIAAQLLAAQAPVAVIVLTCFVVGLRFMMYSAALAPHLKPLPRRWRSALAFLLNDQAFAAVVRRFRTSGDTRNGASYFLGTGVLLWITWQASNLAGYWLGNVLPAAWSLEFIVPLCFLGLLVPALEDGPTRIAALASGVAVVALDALPMRLSVICAGLIGIAAGLAGERRKRR